ncbi:MULTISPECIES: DUF397 domain-containing protein [unclassified Streptosporangium]|uniref:DUF397 domain-containing protein n=1 Tax=unclassified Streptosporangium TaxID=2632669 RepID=UPI002E2B2BD0|nr:MULTISPECIES: DUF397 domain-containing protein [unclassified Streptosporangium]
MTDLDLSRADWRTSTRSQGSGNCVEVATNLSGVVVMRDSKDRSGPVLAFASDEWSAFTSGVQSGDFDF